MSDSVTLSQHDAAESQAASVYQEIDLGATAPPCPVDVQHEVPCDLAKVTLTEVPGTTETTYKWDSSSGTWEEEPPKASGTRQLESVAGRDGVSRTNIQVVAGRRAGKGGTKMKVAVDMAGGPHNAAIHPYALVTDADGNQTSYIGLSKAASFTFPVWGTQFGHGVIGWVVAHFWGASTGAVFTVSVNSCGYRGGQMPVLGSSELYVEVFPSDQFTLKLSIPAMGKFSHSNEGSKSFGGKYAEETSDTRGWRPGVRRTTSNSLEINKDEIKQTSSASQAIGNGFTATESQSITVGDKGIEQTKSDSIQRGSQAAGNSSSTSSEASEGKEAGKEYTKPIEVAWKVPKQQFVWEFTHNGADLSEGPAKTSLTTIYNTIRTFYGHLQALKDAIKDWVPQIGWSFEWNVSFLALDLYTTWGWVETPDLRAYHRFAAGVTGKIFDGTLEFKFGVSLMKGRLVAQISGGFEVHASASCEAILNSPDQDGPILNGDPKIHASAEPEIKAQAVADILSVRAEYTVGVKLGIEVDATVGFGQPHGFHIDLDIQFTGIVAYLIKSGPHSGETSKKYKLIDERPLYKGVFPKHKE